MQTSSSSGGSKMMSPKQMLTTILIVFSTLSFIKLLLLTHSSSASASSSARPHRSAWVDDGLGNGTARNGLAAKELALLRSIVAARAPCRLLVFGLSPQLLALAAEGPTARSGGAKFLKFGIWVPIGHPWERGSEEIWVLPILRILV